MRRMLLGDCTRPAPALQSRIRTPPTSPTYSEVNGVRDERSDRTRGSPVAARPPPSCAKRTSSAASGSSSWLATRASQLAKGRAAGGVRLRAFAPCCRAQSEAHPRCDARRAKSAKQVRAPMRLQPSTVADSASCEIGEERGAADRSEETSRRMIAGRAPLESHAVPRTRRRTKAGRSARPITASIGRRRGQPRRWRAAGKRWTGEWRPAVWSSSTGRSRCLSFDANPQAHR